MPSSRPASSPLLAHGLGDAGEVALLPERLVGVHDGVSVQKGAPNRRRGAGQARATGPADGATNLPQVKATPSRAGGRVEMNRRMHVADQEERDHFHKSVIRMSPSAAAGRGRP